MRKFISLSTLEIAQKEIAKTIADAEPGDALRALYRADDELREAIDAAKATKPEEKPKGNPKKD